MLDIYNDNGTKGEQEPSTMGIMYLFAILALAGYGLYYLVKTIVVLTTRVVKFIVTKIRKK